MEDIAKVFHIEWKILLAQSINFCLVAYILWRFAFRPINKVLLERTTKIEQGLKNAENAKKELESAKEKALGIIDEANKESQKIMRNTLESAERLSAKELEKSRLESEKIFESTKKSLILEKENMMSNAKKEIVELIVGVSSKVLKDVSDERVDISLVNKVLEKYD